MSEYKVTKNNSFEKSTLEYIRISHKNLIEELSSEEHIKEVSNVLKNLSLVEEDVGGEINKLFQTFLQDNKETDILKLLTSISSKSKYEKEQVENCLNNIMNRPEFSFVLLTKDLSEQLSVILKHIFKAIKKHYSKIKNFKQLIDMVIKYSNEINHTDILMRYKTKNPSIKKKNDDVNYLFNNSEKKLIESNYFCTLRKKVLKIIWNLEKNLEKTENTVRLINIFQK